MESIPLSALSNFSGTPFMLLPGQKLAYTISDRNSEGKAAPWNDFEISAIYWTIAGEERRECTEIKMDMLQAVRNSRSIAIINDELKRLLQSKAEYWMQLPNDLNAKSYIYSEHGEVLTFSSDSDVRRFIGKLFAGEASLYPKSTLPSGMLWHQAWMANNGRLLDLPVLFFNYLDTVDAILNIVDESSTEYRKALNIVIGGQFSETETHVLVHIVPAMLPKYAALHAKLIKTSFAKRLPGFQQVLESRLKPGWDCGGFDTIFYQD